jgi:hypothetical protein
MYVDFGRGLHFELREGRNDLAVPPGRFRAQLYSGGWMRLGRAFLDIDTTRGRSTSSTHRRAPSGLRVRPDFIRSSDRGAARSQ